MGLISRLTKTMEESWGRFAWLRRLSDSYYEGLVRREAVLGQITDSDRVLCIGGGCMPCTAMEIQRRTGALVWVADNDLAAVARARDVIRESRLEQKIRVIYGDGSNLDMEDFTVVHIALQVFPKNRVVCNVLKKAAPGTRIVVRHPHRTAGVFYGRDSLFCKHTCACHVAGSVHGNWLSAAALLVKGELDIENNHSRASGDNSSSQSSLAV